MTIRKANATTQNPVTARLAALAGNARAFSLVTPASPDLHPAVDDEVDAGDVGALVAGEEQRDVRHLFGLPEPAQQRPAAHLGGPLAVLQLPAGRVAFDQARRDGVDADPVLASLQCELARHADDSGLVRRVRQRCELLEAER